LKSSLLVLTTDESEMPQWLRTASQKRPLNKVRIPPPEVTGYSCKLRTMRWCYQFCT
jgi:hypothetical protein